MECLSIYHHLSTCTNRASALRALACPDLDMDDVCRGALVKAKPAFGCRSWQEFNTVLWAPVSLVMVPSLNKYQIAWSHLFDDQLDRKRVKYVRLIPRPHLATPICVSHLAQSSAREGGLRFLVQLAPNQFFSRSQAPQKRGNRLADLNTL